MSGGGKMISHRLIGAIAILFCTILTLAGQDLQDAPKSAATLASSQRAVSQPLPGVRTGAYRTFVTATSECGLSFDDR